MSPADPGANPEPTPGPVRVRPAAARDLPTCGAILGHYAARSLATFATEPPTTAHWEQRLEGARSGMPFLVAVDVDDTVLGYAHASTWRAKPAYRHTVEDTIYLAPAARGRGIGPLLLESLISECATQGARQMIAVVASASGTDTATMSSPALQTSDAGLTLEDPHGTASASLHARAGFQEVGRLRRVGHKFGLWVDTILMQRQL